METFFDMEILKTYMETFTMVFCSGFMLTVLLHYVAYGIFKALSLLSILSK